MELTLADLIMNVYMTLVVVYMFEITTGLAVIAACAMSCKCSLFMCVNECLCAVGICERVDLLVEGIRVHFSVGEVQRCRRAENHQARNLLHLRGC